MLTPSHAFTTPSVAPRRTSGPLAPRAVRPLVALLATLMLPVPAAAQDHSPIALRLPGSTRALATGGAFPLGQRDSDAVFYNPALGDALRGFGAAAQGFGRESRFITASAAADWWRGAVAVGVRSLSTSYDTPQPGDTSTLESALRRAGNFAGSEQVLSAAYVQSIRGIRLGVTGHLLQLRRAAFRDESFAFDIAAAHEVSPLRIGLAARNLGPRVEVGGRRTPLPATLALNAATLAAPVGPLDIALAGTLEQRVDRQRGTSAGIGAEVSWWPIAGRTFSARVGGRTAPGGVGGLTAGGGFTGDRIAIDYAWGALDGGATYRFGVRWR